MGKQAIDLVHRPFDVVAAQEGPHFEILFHGHRCEDVRGLRHKGHTLGDPVLRRQMGNILARDPHSPFTQVQHTEHGLHARRLACAIGADNDGDLALIHRDRAFVQNIRSTAPVAARHPVTDQEGFGVRHCAASDVALCGGSAPLAGARPPDICGPMIVRV